MELHNHSDEEIRQRIRDLAELKQKLFAPNTMESFYRDRYERYDAATMEIAALEKELYRRAAEKRHFGIRIKGANT